MTFFHFRTLAPSPLAGEGWGEGAATAARHEGASVPCTPSPQPLSHEGRGARARIPGGTFNFHLGAAR